LPSPVFISEIKVAHVEHAASGFAHHRESLDQNLVQHFLQRLMLLFFLALDAVEIVFFFGVLGAAAFSRLIRCGLARSKAAHPLLNALAELVSLGAQFIVRELLDLRFERVDRPNVRHQRLDDALVLGPENLA
jgi:hypothetical protein